MKNKNLAFRLAKITTNQFAILNEDPITSDNIQIKNELKFGINKDKLYIGAMPSFTFSSNAKPFLKIEIGCHFEIIKDDWKQMINIDTGEINLPVNLLRHLAVLAIGTARGVLHAKTENTPFNQFFIPTINVEDLITEDLTLLFDKE